MEQKPTDRKSIPEFFQTVWSQALVAVTNTEEEATRVISRLQDVAGWSQEEARRQMQSFSEKLVGQRKDLERRVEDTVKQSLTHLQMPRRDDIAQLTSRLDALARRVENLSK